MNNLLDQLLGYSYQLYKLNMRQPAGDYDYLVAWLRSVDLINSDKHFGVAPAGENTISQFANNCPIPYTATKELVKDNYNEAMCLCLVENIYKVLTELLSSVSSGEEITAVNAYLNYTSKLITLLKGEEPGPTPPPPKPPEPEGTNSYINTGKLDEELLPNVDYILYDSSASLFSYDYKQFPEIAGVYNSEDEPLSNDISIKCMHDGTSWKLYISTDSEGVIINRIKINTKRVTRDHIVLGGMMTSSSDNSWKVIDLFTTMSIDS